MDQRRTGGLVARTSVHCQLGQPLCLFIVVQHVTAFLVSPDQVPRSLVCVREARPGLPIGAGAPRRFIQIPFCAPPAGLALDHTAEDDVFGHGCVDG